MSDQPVDATTGEPIEDPPWDVMLEARVPASTAAVVILYWQGTALNAAWREAAMAVLAPKEQTARALRTLADAIEATIVPEHPSEPEAR